MPNGIETFARLVRETPEPDRRLVEEGAYPVQTRTGAWTVPIKQILPTISSYFRRSFALPTSGLAVFRPWDPRANYFFTNEKQFPFVLPKIRGVGGVFVGPGMSLPFTFAAAAGAAHAFVVDYDASVPLAFTPLYGALLAMAPTRAHFVSLATGIPIDSRLAAELAEKSGLKLMGVMGSSRANTSFTASVRDSLGGMFAGVAELGESIEPVLNRWFRMMGNILQLVKITTTVGEINEEDFRSRKAESADSYGPDEMALGGLLSSEAAYAAERMLFLEGKVTGVPADLAGPDMNLIAGAMEAMGQPLGVFYLSNAHAYLLAGKNSLAERAALLLSLYRNIERMPHAADATIVSLTDYEDRHTIDRVANFMKFAFPHGLTGDATAEIALRLLTLKTAADFVPPISMNVWLYDWGCDSDRKLVQLLHEMFSFGLLYAEKDWKYFVDRMTAQSETFRNMTNEERELFLLYLMNARIIGASHPYVLKKGSALINVEKVGESATDIGNGFLDIWNERSNPRFNDVEPGWLMPDLGRFPLTQTIFQKIISYVEATTGKSREDIIVAVPGFGANHIELSSWLSTGVKVIAVETPLQIDVAEAEARLLDSPLYDAYYGNRLVMKKVGSELPEADIVIWTFPGPSPMDVRQMPTLMRGTQQASHDHIAAPVTGGGILILQSENDYYFNQLENDGNFQKLAEMKSTGPGHYLVHSDYLKYFRGDDIRVGIYRRIARDTAHAASPGSTVTGLVEETGETSGGATAARTRRSSRRTAQRSSRRYGSAQVARVRQTSQFRPAIAASFARPTVRVR